MESLPSHSLRARVIQFESRLLSSVMGIGISLKSRGHPHKGDKNFSKYVRTSARCKRPEVFVMPFFLRHRVYITECRTSVLAVRRIMQVSRAHSVAVHVGIHTTYTELGSFSACGPSGLAGRPRPTGRRQRAPRRDASDRCRRPAPGRGVRRRGRRPSVRPRSPGRRPSISQPGPA